MTIKGTPKLNELRLAQVSVDFTSQTTQISATAALFDAGTGVSTWYKPTGGQWSAKTLSALKEFTDSVEADMAGALFIDGSVEDDSAIATDQKPAPAGLGERLGNDVPEM